MGFVRIIFAALFLIFAVVLGGWWWRMAVVDTLTVALVTTALMAAALDFLLCVLYRFEVKRLEAWGYILGVLLIGAGTLMIALIWSMNLVSYVYAGTVAYAVLLFLLAMALVILPVASTIDYVIFLTRRRKSATAMRASWARFVLSFAALVAVGVYAYAMAQKPQAFIGVIAGSGGGTGQICTIQNLGPAPATDVVLLRLELAAPYDASFQIASQWLASRGFSVDHQVSRDTSFSGTVGQVEQAFGIQGSVNKYCMSWGMCDAGTNPDAPVNVPIPVALASAVAKISGPSCPPPMMPAKPVIYLYPTHQESVSVTLDYAGTITDVYPSFDQGTTWSVVAYPGGRIIDDRDGQPYSYLFWEGQDHARYDLSTGFVVKGSDTAAFLQKKLAAMGLTPKEYNEFIVYWLPKLAHDPYNLIHFAGSEYTDTAKLVVDPAPDSILRVFMVYKPLAAPVAVEPQTFPPFVRKGFTVVEWGGTER